MYQEGVEKNLSEEVSFGLVEAQYRQTEVEQSCQGVGKRFGLSESRFQNIEQEGLENE